MPDIAKDSSTKGLWDEEKQIIDNLWGTSQTADTRWIELWDRPVLADGHANSRKFGTGRMVVNRNHVKTNPWLLACELAIAGKLMAPHGLIRIVHPPGAGSYNRCWENGPGGAPPLLK